MMDGRHVAQELRSRVESFETLSGRTVTVSIGLATLRPGEDGCEWMRRADAKLYEAKENGRNRVVA